MQVARKGYSSSLLELYLALIKELQLNTGLVEHCIIYWKYLMKQGESIMRL